MRLAGVVFDTAAACAITANGAQRRYLGFTAAAGEFSRLAAVIG